jgi:kumamolisin
VFNFKAWRPGVRRVTIAGFVSTTALMSLCTVSAASLAQAARLVPPPHPPDGKVRVQQGIGSAVLHNSRLLGATPPQTPEQVSFVLAANHLGALASAVAAGQQRQLSVPQFAAYYGQPQRVVSALVRYLSSYGISATTVYADGLDVATTGTAGEYNAALSVSQQEFRLRSGRAGARIVRGSVADPELPASFGRDVLAILGLSSYAPFAANLRPTPPDVRKHDSVAPTTQLTGNLTPQDFARNYGLDALYRQGMSGSGQTIGIVTLGATDVQAASYFWQHVLGMSAQPGQVTVEDVDRGPRGRAGSRESDLDVEQSGAVAPGASIVVYQAPNTDSGYADAFFQAASANLAGTVSTSWGESETAIAAAVRQGQESSAYSAALNEAFLELAAQRESTFVASGDDGAYDAYGDLGTTNLSVDEPADSPFVTSAGGTTLGGTVSATVYNQNTLAPQTLSVVIPRQRIWSWDWLWPFFSDFGFATEAEFAEQAAIAGGGGGFSMAEPKPRYQYLVRGTSRYSAVGYLMPDRYSTALGLPLPSGWSFSKSPGITNGESGGRAVPDLSADADPYTGYLVYVPGSLQGGWGGTSFVAPQLNGAAAVIDQYLGRRAGFWNPAIYSFAASGHDPFSPLSRSGSGNDNLYFTGTPGQAYNAGAGLGVPDLAAIAHDFAVARSAP